MEEQDSKEKIENMDEIINSLDKDIRDDDLDR